MSRERAAREVVEGIVNGFENVDSNQVRSALEASDSLKEVNAALGAFGEYLNEVIDPEIVMDFSTFQSALTPDAPARFHGPEGWREMWLLWFSAWEDYQPDTEIEQLNHEQVLVTAHSTLKGRGSGVEVDWGTVGVWTVRDGRLVGMHNFLTREDALAAVEKGLA
jgi:ketosteroid isomerase-like protein